MHGPDSCRPCSHEGANLRANSALARNSLGRRRVVQCDHRVAPGLGDRRRTPELVGNRRRMAKEAPTIARWIGRRMRDPCMLDQMRPQYWRQPDSNRDYPEDPAIQDTLAGADSGSDLYVGRHGQAQWHRPRGVSAPCPRLHCRASDRPRRGTTAVARRRQLARRPAPGSLNTEVMSRSGTIPLPDLPNIENLVDGEGTCLHRARLRHVVAEQSSPHGKTVSKRRLRRAFRTFLC